MHATVGSSPTRYLFPIYSSILTYCFLYILSDYNWRYERHVNLVCYKRYAALQIH